MTIENRDAVVAGVKLTAKYKGEDWTLEVLPGDPPTYGFVGKRPKDAAQVYKSPSAAGSAVMGGTACNGWRFWSIEGGEPVGALPTKSPAKAQASRAARNRRAASVFEKHKDQSGLEPGQVRYACDAGAGGFVASPEEFPGGVVDACPEGHRNDDPELSTPPAPEVVTQAEPTRSEPRKLVFRNPNQRGVASGQTRWYCAECKGSFVADASSVPTACPKGHADSVAQA